MAACGAIAMIAALSYPGFISYWPALFLAGWWSIRRSESRAAILPGAAGAIIGFAIPLAATFVFVRNPQVLALDPATHSGLFRGGGSFAGSKGSLVFRVLQVYYLGMPMLRDLFVRGESYYFDVSRPDFSGRLAPIGLACVVATSAWVLRHRGIHRRIVLAAALLFATSLVLPTLSDAGAPGLRRGTGLLTAYFVLFAVAWRVHATTTSASAWPRRAGLALCLLLPLDSATKWPSLLRDVSADHVDQNRDWFAVGATPQRSLDVQITRVASGETLRCAVDARVRPCRYQEIYAAIAGARAWNGLAPIDVHAVDWKTGRDVTLTPDLWTTYYFPH